MSRRKNSRQIRIVVSSIIILTFLYSQILWAAGYELYRTTLDEEELSLSFKSPDELQAQEARTRFLMHRQREIEGARRFALNWSYPLHEPNRELSNNLYYQKINATRALIEGKSYADEITGRIAAYGKYYVKHDDGMVTWYFNALLTDIMGEKVKDKMGHQSIQDTLEMLYNERRQLVSFNQKITDERSNITNKIWDSATYWTKDDSQLDYHKGKNLLSGYHEQITYPTGEIIDRNVANLTYYTMPDQDINPSRIEKQIASYDETKKSNQSPDAPTSSHWYDSSYLKRPFTYTSLDPFDEEKYPKEEDRYDYLLTGFMEDSTTLDVTTSRIWSNPVYNDNEQITAYHESIDSLGFHTERGFYDAKYDEWGRLTSYRETIDTEGLATDRYWHDGQYNNIDQLTYYKEDLFQGGVWTYTTWEDPTYNSIGQLTSYHTVTDSGGIQIDTTRSEIIYNSYGLPESYNEVVQSLGMTITTQRRNITYEDHGWITGWDDTIREVAGYVDETGPVNIDRTYTLRRYETTYHWNGLVSSYREILIDPLDITTKTYRYSMQYNHQGLLISYIEEILKTGFGIEISTKTIRDNITYNKYGQMEGFHDIITTDETPGLTIEVTRAGIHYNNEGWVTEYTETVHKYAENREQYDTTVTTHRYDIVYSRIGKPIRYKEETTNELGTRVAKEWWGGEYNPVGLLTAFYEKTTYPDKEITVQAHQYRIIYDEYDRIIRYINEEVDPFNVTTRTEHNVIKYIGQLQEYYIDKILRTGIGLNQEWNKTWEGEYNTVGQVKKYTETQTDPFDVRTILKMMGMSYNNFGQLENYTTITTRPGYDYENERIWNNGKYNKLNQLNEFTEKNKTIGAGIELLITTTRTLTEYNELGYVKEYREGITDESTDESSLDKTTERRLYDTTYEKGLLKKYTQEETALGVTKTTKRKNTLFNSIGQEFVYTDEITETNQLDKTTTITKTDITYNEKGRQTAFKEEIKEMGLNLNYKKTTNRTDIEFDSFGNITKYTDTINETNATDYTTTKEWSDVEYNSLGMLTKYKETTNKGTRSVIIVTRDNIKYDTKGRQDEYIETIEDDAAPDKTVTKGWKAISYNGYGQLEGYLEMILEKYNEGQPTEYFIARINIRTDMEYTMNLLTKYNELVVDSIYFDPVTYIQYKTTNNTWQATYNTLGQVSSYKQEQKETGVNWDRTIKQERQNITYDDQGREYGYVQIDNDSISTNKIVTTARIETTYNGRGLVSSYKESQNFDGGSGSGMDYTIEKTRTDITYNNDEQMTSYMEEQENTATSGKTAKTTWTAQGYDLTGQLMGDTTITEETGNAKLTEKRSNITYNDRGQVIEYTKIIESIATANLTEEIKWQGSYNNLGLLQNYSETDTKYDKATNGNVYKNVQKVNRAFTYNSMGQVKSYTETNTDHDLSTDAVNKTITTDWKDAIYDDLGQITGYTQTVKETAAGLATEKTIVRSGITYNNGLMTNYAETQTDNIAPNIAKTITWTGGYNNLGQLSNYLQSQHDTGTDSHGATIDSTTILGQSGIAYNNLGQITGFTNTTVYPSGLTETVARIDTQYNNLGQITYYYEEITRSDQPNVKTTRTFNGTYDRNGWLDTFEVVEIDYLLGIQSAQTIKSLSNVGYNEKGQITSYHSVSTEFGITTTTDWSGGEYNSEGQLIKFHEVSATLGVVTTRDWQGAIYNDDGRVIYYTETKTTVPGKTEYIEWCDAEYDTDGNLTKFTEKTTVDDLLITRTRSGASYTSTGLILNYDEIINKKDISTNGAVLNATTTRNWSTTSSDYDSKNKILRYTETTTENGVATNTEWTASGYTDKDQVTGYIQVSTANGITTTITRTNMVYNANGELTGYKDTIMNSNVPDLTTTITRTNQTYNLGQLISFTETINYEGAGLDQTITVNRTNTTYANGLETGYSETQTDTAKPGLTQTVTRSNQTYNIVGQITSYKDVNTANGITTTTEHTQMGYNINGELVGYKDKITSSNISGLTTTITRSNQTYNSGQLISYIETINYKGAGLDQTITTNRTDTTYTNGLETGYTETQTDTAKPGLTQTITRSAQSYNTLGQIIGYTDVNTANGITTTTERAQMGYNANGELTGYKDIIMSSNISGLTTTITRTNQTYNNLGQLISYTETINYKGAGLDQTITTNRTNTTYANGHETGYTETQTDTAKPGLTQTINRLAQSYNTLGQVTSYKDITTANGITKTTERTQMAYNANGELIGYKDKITSSNISGLTITITRSNQTYNLGQLISYTETINYKGTGLDQTITTNRTDTTYTNGLETGYTETQTDTATPGLTQTITRSGQTHNTLGQVTGFTDTRVMSDGRQETVVRNSITYNTSGLEKGYKETVTDNVASGLTKTVTLSDEIYNSLGQLNTYTKTEKQQGAGLDRTITTQRTNTIYTNGLETDYTEIVTDTMTPDLTTEITRQNQVYNTQGQLIGYKDIQNTYKTTDRSKLDVTITTTRDSAQTAYNTNGRITGFKDEIIDTSKPGLTQTITMSGSTYDSLGQIKTFTKTERLQGAGLDQTITTNRTDTTYANGLETGYTETVTDTARTGVTILITRSGQVYNTLGQMVGFDDEQNTYKTTNRNKLDITIKTTRDSASTAYNTNGQLTGYKDTIEDSTAPKLQKTITVTGRLYNVLGQLTDLNEEIHYKDNYADPLYNPYELTITKTLSGITYNSNNQETGSTEVLTRSDEADLEYTITISSKTYNMGQLKGFNKELTEHDTVSDTYTTTNLIQSNMLYNTKNQLTGYNQTITDSTGSYTSDYSGATYNNLGQLQTYHHELSDYDGNVTPADFSAPAYNKENQLNNYELTTPDYEIKWSKGLYNELGQLTRYKEDHSISGITNWTGKTFEDKGQYLDFHSENILGPNTAALYNILPETIDKALDTKEIDYLPAPSAKKTKASLIKTLLNLFISPLTKIIDNSSVIKSSAAELKTQTSLPIKLLINTYYNVLLPQQGITPLTLQEKSTFFKELPNDKGLELEITTRVETQYDPTGQVVSYTEIITQMGGTWSPVGELMTMTQQKTVTREDIIYNTLGQVISYEESETNQNGVKKETERNDIEYTELGLTESYSETRFELGIEKHEDVSNLTYNENGQLVAYQSILEEKAAGYMANGTPIEYGLTTITERLATTYGESGLVTGLKERIWSSSASALSTITEKSGITYNLFGQISGLIEKITTPFETVTTTKSNLTYAPGGNLLSFQEEIKSTIAPDLVTIRNWSGAVYSPRGELKGYIEKIKTNDLIREIRKSEIAYDILGRVIGYKLTEKDFGTRTTIRQNITYNPLHQLLGYEEITDQGRILFSGAEYDIAGKLLKYTKQTSELGQPVITQQRLSTLYNDYGQIIAYDDQITKLGLTQQVSVNNIQYNSMGQTLGYIQQSRTTGGPLDYTETTIRSNSLYDTYGRLASYSEESVIASPDKTGAKQSRAVTLSYNSYDQLTNYTETGTKYGDTYQYSKTNMQYDSQNRLISYDETNVGVAERSSASITLTYNNLNQITNRSEQGTDRKGSYTINTSNIKYNDIGQQTSFTHTRTQNNITTTTNRTSTSYNSVGLVSGYTETTTTPLGASTNIVSNITYDKQSRTLYFTETGTNEDGTSYNLNRGNIQYDAKQRISSFHETGYNPQTGNYNYTRNNITYDKFNRITNYSEQGSNSQSGSYNLNKQLTYDNLDQVTSTSEQGWRQNGGSYNSNRNSITYDALGRVTEFRESDWTQGQGNYNFHRYNIQYTNVIASEAKQSYYTAVSSYTETGWQEGKGTYTTNRSNMQYEKGMLKSFHEKTDSSDGSTVEFDRTGITYNSNGEITGCTENGTRKGQGNYNLSRSNMQYNSIGQLISINEQGSNWEGSYNYQRYEINYSGDGRISSYRENGTDTKGKGYNTHRYSMGYDGAGRLANYSENSNDGHRDVWNMSYDGNGQLVSQEVRTDKDNFQFGGNSRYTFSYDGNGNLTQTRIDTNDYWVTFDGKGNQNGFGFSGQMQNYIDEMKRQAEEAQRRAEEAEREADRAMRDADRAIREAIEAEGRAEEEAFEKIVLSDGKARDYWESWHRHLDFAEQAEQRGDHKKAEWHRHKAEVRKEQFEERAKKVMRNYAEAIKQEADRVKQEAQREADAARREAAGKRGEAEGKVREAEQKVREAEDRARQAQQNAERAKQLVIAIERKLSGQDRTGNVQNYTQKTAKYGLELQVTKVKEDDGSTIVKIYNPLTGSTRVLRFDGFGDVTFKQIKDISGQTTHLETHNFTRDSGGRITADDYYKNVVTYTPTTKPGEKGGASNMARTTVEESGRLEYNKFGQVIKADITRNVVTEIQGLTKGKDGKSERGYREIDNYTMEIHMTADQDSMGRVVAEHETTHIFGTAVIASDAKQSSSIDVTITRDRTYDYTGNSLLPSGWNETIKRSDQDITQETNVWDIKYNDKGQTTEYRERNRIYGETTNPDGTKDRIDLITEKYRYDILYNTDNRTSSYREIRHSNDKPGLVDYAQIFDISYDDLGRMTGYTEILNQFGFNDATQANLLFMSAKLWENAANVNADLLKTTTTTKRSEITYNGLNQITSYTDNITNPDGTKQTVEMYNMTYLPTGELNGYTQKATEYENQYDENGNVVGSKAKESQTTKIDRTVYDSLSRVVSKTGTIDGEEYSYEVRAFDAVGRPVQYIETQGDAEIVHFGILFDSLGRVSEEYIKTSAESGEGIFSSEEKSLTQYRYSYDQYGIRDTSYENEIYHEVSSNPIGEIVKAIVGIAISFIPGLNFLVYAALMAVTNFAFSMLSGAELGQALIGAAISFVASVVARGLSGAMTGTGVANALTATIGQGLSPVDWVIRGISLVDSLVASKNGKGLLESIFGKNADAIFGVVTAIAGFLAGGKGITGPPDLIPSLQAVLGQQLIARLITIGITEVLKRNASPYITQFLSQFLNEFVSSYFSFKMQDVKDSYYTDQGFQKTKDGEYLKWEGNKQIRIAKDGRQITDVFDDQGNYIHTEKLLTNNLTAITNEFGTVQYYTLKGDQGLTYLDTRGIAIFTKLTNGDLIAYDIDGKQMAYLKEGSEPIWENGKITKTYITTDEGKEYYNTKGEFEAFVPQANEPFYNIDGRITGSYSEQNGIIYIYNERGQLDSSITPAISNGKVQGYYIDTQTNTTYTDNQGNPIWYKNNTTPNSPVYFLDPFNQSISGQLLTKLDENGLIQGYIYQDFAENEYTFYDQNGEQLLPAINPTKLYTQTINYVKDLLGRAKDALILGLKEEFNPRIRSIFDFGTNNTSNDAILHNILLGVSILDPSGGLLKVFLTDLLTPQRSLLPEDKLVDSFPAKVYAGDSNLFWEDNLPHFENHKGLSLTSAQSTIYQIHEQSLPDIVLDTGLDMGASLILFGSAVKLLAEGNLSGAKDALVEDAAVGLVKYTVGQIITKMKAIKGGVIAIKGLEGGIKITDKMIKNIESALEVFDKAYTGYNMLDIFGTHMLEAAEKTIDGNTNELTATKISMRAVYHILSQSNTLSAMLGGDGKDSTSVWFNKEMNNLYYADDNTNRFEMYDLFREVYSEVKVLSENDFKSMGLKYETEIVQAILESYLGLGSEYYNDLSFNEQNIVSPSNVLVDKQDKAELSIALSEGNTKTMSNFIDQISSGTALKTAKDYYLEPIKSAWSELKEGVNRIIDTGIVIKDFYLDQAYTIGDYWSEKAGQAKDFYLDQASLIGDFWTPGQTPEGMDKNSYGMWEDLVTPSDSNSLTYHFIDQLVNGDPLKTAGHYYWDPLVDAKNELFDRTKESFTYAKYFTAELAEQMKTNEQLGQSNLDYLFYAMPFLLPAKPIVHQIVGTLVNYNYDIQNWSPVIDKDTNQFSINGINNKRRELASSPYSVDQANEINIITGKNTMVTIPLFETNYLRLTESIFSITSIPQDIGMWLADKILNVDITGNEIKTKLDYVFSKIPEEAKKNGITLQLYSGSFDTTLEVLTESQYPFDITVVVLGGPSITGNNWFRHIAPGDVTGANIGRIVNIWGENDIFTWPIFLGMGGYKEYKGADVVNIEIKGIGHYDYLNNDNNKDPNSLSYKAREFVNEIVQYSYDKNKLNDFLTLNTPFINYDSKKKTYIVDLSNYYLEDLQ